MTYNKTNWKTGDVITANKLNNLESGVSNNDTSVTELNEAKAVFAQNILNLQTQTGKNTNDISTLKTSKANQTEVDQIQGDITALDGDVATISNTVDTLQTGVQSNTENIINLQKALPNKQDKLIAGNNITIDSNNVISATSGGSSEPPANMVTTDTTQTITGSKTLDKIILPTDSPDKGIYIAGNTSPSISAQYGSLLIENVSGFYCERLSVGSSSNKNGVITVGAYPTTGVSEIKFTGYNSNNTSTVVYNGIQYDASTKKYYFGDTTLPLYILGSPICDIYNKKFLTQKNVTAGDNISITETTDGIKISSTSTGGNYLTEDSFTMLPDSAIIMPISPGMEYTPPSFGVILFDWLGPGEWGELNVKKTSGGSFPIFSYNRGNGGYFLPPPIYVTPTNTYVIGNNNTATKMTFMPLKGVT